MVSYDRGTLAFSTLFLSFWFLPLNLSPTSFSLQPIECNNAVRIAMFMFIKMIIIIKLHTLNKVLHNIVLWNHTFNFHSPWYKSLTQVGMLSYTICKINSASPFLCAGSRDKVTMIILELSSKNGRARTCNNNIQRWGSQDAAELSSLL